MSRACSRVIISCHRARLTLPCNEQPRLLELPRRCAPGTSFPPETARAAPAMGLGVAGASRRRFAAMKTYDTKSKSSIPPGKCKGTLLVNLRSFVTTNRDAGAWERLVTSLPKSDRDVLNQPLLASSWYPIGVWNRALRTHVRTANDQAAEIKRFARYVADRDLNTVLKFALSIAMPDTIVARTGMFWSRYFDAGKVFPRMVKPREWVLTITAPPGTTRGPRR